jgi:phospholipid/cholesterol/gamma-HCH transport system substrate-binding protein
MMIQKHIQLSEDSIASVKTSGLIGDKYIMITLGGAEEKLQAGGRISETESAVDLESLISQYVFGDI